MRDSMAGMGGVWVWLAVVMGVAIGQEVGDGSQLVARAGCDGRSSMRQLQDMSSALLRSHRCMVRDVPVAVPLPSNTIPDIVLPSHIVVQRCTGLCLESLGSSCIPRKVKLEKHNIVTYVNSTPYCSTIELEHHRGPCKCSCETDSRSCSHLQVFQEDSCRCSCSARYTPTKVTCTNSSLHKWNHDTCHCECKDTPRCPKGQYQSPKTCRCVPTQQNPNCELYNVSVEAAGEIYTVYVGVAALAVVAVTITATLCCIVSRRRTYQDLGLAQDHPVGTAYTITINQSRQDLDQVS